MRKAVLFTSVFLLFFGLTYNCLADDISQSGVAQAIGEDIQKALNGMFESLPAIYDSPSEGFNYINSGGNGCVDVDIELTDTVFLDNPAGPIAISHFELTNCGDVAALIFLDFTVTMNFLITFDTAYVIPPVPIWLGPGQSFVSDCQFPVPPMEGSITVCVTARHGNAVDFDCDTIVVTASGSPGTPFSGCGVLVPTQNCLLFATYYGNDGPYYPPDTSWAMLLVLENYSSYQAGDSVFVHGTLFMTGDSLCPLATGKLVSNTIFYCDTLPLQPYEACGILVQGAECILFQSSYPDNLLLILDNLGGFGLGDTVHVAGLYDPDCLSFCMQGDGCLLGTQIESCGGNPSDTISTCGVLYWNDYCMLFMPTGFPATGDSGFFYIQNYDGFGDGDTVFVEGMVAFGCEIYCGQPIVGCIVENIIDSCGGTNPPAPYEGCGILIPYDNCIAFAPLNNFYYPYILQNYGSFGVGDTVFVAGVIDGYTDACSLQTVPVIANHYIDYCNNTPPDTLFYVGCGMLVEDSGCVLFYPFDELFPPAVLDDYGGFGIYDTVFVVGMVEFGCQNSCFYASDVCLHNDSIRACSTYPPEPYGSCGILIEMNNCLLFAPFMPDSIYYLDPSFAAWLFVLDNYGNFGHGDSVWVYGNLEFGCSTACPGALGCVYDNIIESCSTPPDTIYYSGCGFLFEDSGCVKFLPMDGMFPPLLLTDYGIYGSGDTVLVEGIIDLTVGCECLGIMQPCLNNYMIGDCGGQPPDSFYYSGCGVLVDDTGCVFFYPDDNLFYKALLNDYGGFTIGDSVYIEGLVMLDSMVGCECMGIPSPCIFNNVITECNTNPGGDTLSLCGVLMGDSNCVYFAPLVYDSLIYVFGFLLENYGSFGIYDTVLVTGEVVPINPSPDCPEVCMQFINNSIEYCGFGPADSVYIKDDITATNFPNPFNPITTISVSLPVATPVSLKIYNILGQEVETLVDGEVLQGDYKFIWDGSGRASGIYLYRIATDHSVITRKMTLTK
ncbi:MAG: T9SS type A sorting domain-containing protein [Candidatus Zixiibacteriota bacterium]